MKYVLCVILICVMSSAEVITETPYGSVVSYCCSHIDSFIGDVQTQWSWADTVRTDKKNNFLRRGAHAIAKQIAGVDPNEAAFFDRFFHHKNIYQKVVNLIQTQQLCSSHCMQLLEQIGSAALKDKNFAYLRKLLHQKTQSILNLQDKDPLFVAEWVNKQRNNEYIVSDEKYVEVVAYSVLSLYVAEKKFNIKAW